MINAGELDQKIKIQHNTSATVNGLNENIESWVDLSSEWAAVKEMGSRELYYAQKVYAESTAVFKIRYRSGVDSKMRILYGTRIFQIIGTPIDPDKKRAELLISAKEVL